MNDSEGRARIYHIGGRLLQAPPLAKGLHMVGTPIGNMADITLRALEALAGADAVLCEDTRHSGRLLDRYGIRQKLIAYHDHNAQRMRPRILKMLAEGAALALISDAGMPVVSDPGMKLAREAAAAGIAVHVVPGPSAALAALAVSGLASDRFLFAGFPPARPSARRRWLEGLAREAATLILFESPHRVAQTLQDMAATLGPRKAALCRELTKLHEEVIRLPLPDLAQEVARRGGVKGEITLVVEGATAPQAALEDVEQALRAALREMPPGKAAAAVARRFGLARRKVHDMAMKLK